jgi:PIN domain nuclease of toxin-antitoxin system
VEAVIYLDTNVVLWLAGAPEQLSTSAKQAINSHDVLLYSPMVGLELEYLHETGRVQRPAVEVLEHLRSALNLKACERPFAAVVAAARELKWTRDPFDRLIAAQAAVGSDQLLTRDKIIRANYPHAFW